MASGSFLQSRVLCPFYLADNGANRIFCEGIVPGSQVQSFFKDRNDFKKQMTIFCSGRYKNCEICAAIEKKYEEE